MNYLYKRTRVSVLFGTLFLLLGACSDDAPSESEGTQQAYSVIMKGIMLPDSGSPEAPQDVSIYQFYDSNLYKQQQLHPNQDGQADINALSGSRLYFLSGVTLPEIEDAMTEEKFRNIIIGEGLHDNSAPNFMTAVVELNKTPHARNNSEISIDMKRGVARIDLNTTADNNTRIEVIIVENAPLETFPFLENTPVSDKTISYVKKFDPAFGGEQAEVFRIFESTHPINVILRGKYNTIPINLKMQLPRIERNKVYELSVLNIGSTFEGTFQIKPWEEGDTIIGKPDTKHRILIDPSRSQIPEGVSVNFENNIVEVPATGINDMKLAFFSDAPIDISSVEGSSSNVTLGDMLVSEETMGVVSIFNVSVTAQGNGRLGYSVMVHLKNALLTGSYDYVEIRVAPSEKQIETVEIGGYTWMAFNACSNDLDDQIYPLDGATIEEMYHDCWISTVGGLFQFGRLYKYLPWQGYNPSNDVGHQGAANVPWSTDTLMPCPEGYRVPTRKELESLFPKNQQIPGTYTAGNGEKITASLHVGAGSLSTPTGVTGTQHYVKFTSEETNRYIIIPLAGGKGDKSTTNNPAFGKRAILWSNDRNGCPGGYAWTYWLPFEGKDSTTMIEKQLQMEAFASVRCIKK